MMHLHVRNEKGKQTAFALILCLWPLNILYGYVEYITFSNDLYNDTAIYWIILQRCVVFNRRTRLRLIAKYSGRMPEGNFSLLARITFPLVYVFPASKVFRQVLSEK